MSEDSTSTPAFEKELFPLSPPPSPVGHHFTLTLLLKSTQLRDFNMSNKIDHSEEKHIM
jgi:hypothetical protein